jgi:hypothetical protein
MKTPPDTAFVKTHGLTKVFKDFWLRPRVVALEDLDLEIRPAEVRSSKLSTTSACKKKLGSLK